MAAPFGLVTRPLSRDAESKKRGSRNRPGGGYAGKDPTTDPELAAYLRARHPDFDEFLGAVHTADYTHRCKNDAQFASKYRIPPVVEPIVRSKEHTSSVDAVCWGPEEGYFVS